MDPNNNLQQPGTQPVQPVAPTIQQPAQQPMNQPAAMPPVQESPRNGGKKGLILILILLILVLGMAYYVFFAKQRINNIQKTSTENTTIAIPTITTLPAAPSSVDEVSVENPEADLKEIENDLQGL